MTATSRTDAESHTELLARHLGAEIIARGGSRRIGWARENSTPKGPR
jgi:hypothetical protein